MDLKEKVNAIQIAFLEDLNTISSSKEADALRVKYLGKKGPLQELLKSLKDLTSAERPMAGQIINDLKVEITKKVADIIEKNVLKEEELQLNEEKLDVTLPGRRRYIGRKHVITQTLESILNILESMGFSIQQGPDIDTNYYNFEALNFPPDHPALDMQDTFYLSENMLLRTHTSNVQVRTMESHKPPLRVVAPGKVYRNEEISARSHVFFHQIEGFYIDTKVTFGDLLATLDEMLKRIFFKDIQMRYRPSYFPFVEPGMEVDIHCLNCDGQGCAICKQTGWLEILGAGMIHPEVLKNGGIEPEEYSGFAWGMGIERIAMLKYKINDIRLFTENNLRFLEQFSPFIAC